MEQQRIWNPLTEWKHTDVEWIRVNISREDLKRFTTRSTPRGLLQAVGFLLVLGITGALCYLALAYRLWALLVVALYVHGTFYAFFGNALHELSHNTVFGHRGLNTAVTALFGWLYWPMNPHHYRLSHLKYHHRYTLYQGSDGEDVPNYVELTPRFVLPLFVNVLHLRAMAQDLYRLFTLQPTSHGWRGRGFRLDTWERFVLTSATEKERRQVTRLGVACLVGHVLFTAGCIALGLWFLPILVTFAPFYGAGFLGYMAGIHQHAACEPNNPDFLISCGDAVLDPLTSFLFWRMEFHIEHHMFAAIPCYNLRAFSRFAADQLPPKERALSRLRKLNEVCKEKYGSRQAWRDRLGLYKGY
jgi:fatty acid desaturase